MKLYFSRPWLLTLSLLLISASSGFLFFKPATAAPPALTMPSGFVSETVLSSLPYPTTIAWTPDGRMFVAQKDGQVRVAVSNGSNYTLLPQVFIDISAEVNNFWDRGLLGIAVHPDFPATPYIYLLYVYDPPGVIEDGSGARVSRLTRVSADPNNTNVALPGSEVVILGTNSTLANIGDLNNGLDTSRESCRAGGVAGAALIQDCLPSDSPSHSIGTVMFGADGSLWVGNGDGSSFDWADPRALRVQDLDSLSGKILHIDPLTGNGYSNNPFYDGDLTSNRSKIWDYGLRNPFRFTVNPTTNELFVGDVGWNGWEEINTGSGKNFGWPCYEGNDTGSLPQPSYAFSSGTEAACSALYAQGMNAVQAPLYSYNHNVGSSAIEVGAFYQGTTYPAQYQDALFIQDYNGDWISYLTFDANGNATVNSFATDVSPNGGPVQLVVGPDTNLYYVVYDGANNSEIRRIRYTSGGNTPPTAKLTATPSSGQAPLSVTFSNAGSFDPDAQPLTYLWNFGNGDTSTAPNPVYTYTVNGTYTPVLTVTDSLGANGTDSGVIVVGNTAPVANITAPITGTTYNVGDTINFSGTGTDAEDGVISGNNLYWEVKLHHNQHIHFNYFNFSGSASNFVTPDHGDNNWMELCLVASDSGGLSSAEVCRSLLPNTVNYTFVTEPSGLQLTYEGVAYPAPFTVNPVIGSTQDVIAPPTQGCYTFDSWSDGGARSHQIMIGSTPEMLTATYQLNPLTSWLNQDIGSVSLTGSACNNSGTFTVNASGADIGNNADAFHYVYRQISGDSQIVARVVTMNNTDGWAKAGVMMRESLTADAANAMVALTPGNGITFQQRATPGGSSTNINTTGPSTPYWVRLVRNGNTFSAYSSTNGSTWTQLGTDATISMTQTIYIGLAVTSHNNSQLNTATFNNVTIIGNTPPTISDIVAQSTNEDTPTGAIAFTVSDLETPANNLTVTGSSSNPALVSNSNLVFGGNGSNRTLTITPSLNASGMTTITVIVSDGQDTATDTFTLTVIEDIKNTMYLPLIFKLH